jgi:tetratricopeptide (TPR) repeat protein
LRANKVITLFFSVLLSLLTGDILFAQNKQKMLDSAQKSWVKREGDYKQKFEALLISYNQDKHLKAICNYYLGEIELLRKEYKRAERHFLEVLSYKFSNGREIIYRPEVEKGDIVTGVSMSANEIIYNSYVALKRVYTGQGDFKKALVYAKKQRENQHLIAEGNSLAFMGSKKDIRFMNDFMLSQMYSQMGLYDSASYLLLPYCLGKERENLHSLSLVKQELPKMFTLTKMKQQSISMLESISERSKTSEGVKVKWFGQEMILYSTEIGKLKTKDAIANYIKASDLYKFMQGI